MKLSICIPTYNRAGHLANCLNSIILCNSRSELKFQVCVSDNNSDDETESVVRHAQTIIDIKYQKNSRNLGIPRNFLKVVGMADGEFVWLLGDDDLLMPDCLQRLVGLINEHPDVDFFYVNAYHLTTQYVMSFPQPFDTNNLPSRMEKFSSLTSGGEIPFLRLVDPRVSFDFLGGMFLSVFRRQKWGACQGVLDEGAITDPRTFSHFDNTFPHIKIFASAFSGSKAYFNANPFSVCLTGAREWAPMYPLVRSVRMVEALDEYRKNGLPFLHYLRCRNFALSNFLPDVVRMLVCPEQSGRRYVSLVKLMLRNMLYPNFYLSPFIPLIRKWRVRRAAINQNTVMQSQNPQP